MAIRRSVRLKFYLMITLLLAGVFALAGSSQIAYRSLHEQTGRLISVDMVAGRAMGTIDMRHDGLSALVYRSLADPQKGEQIRADLQEYTTSIKDCLSDLAKLDLGREIGKALDDSKAPLDSYVEATTGIIDQSLSGGVEGARARLPEFDERFTALETSLGKLGDLIATRSQNETQASEMMAQQSERRLAFFAGLSLLAVAGISLFFAVGIVNPVIEASRMLQKVASGNLKVRAQVTSQDELGQMSQALNEMTVSLQDAICQIALTADTLGGTSSELSDVNACMSQSSERAAEQSQVASDAAIQVESNISSIAAGAEEMSVTISEIARRTSEASTISLAAVRAAKLASGSVAKLDEIGGDIARVVKVIASVAEQTNLLALNATIEAARAGDAGRGFAVVANEVKELARETAKATDDISSRIEAIQVDTQTAISSISEIVAVIDTINEMTSLIAASIEEQSITTNEITQNICQAAVGSGEIARIVSSLSEVVAGTNRGVSRNVDQVGRMSSLAIDLNVLLDRFDYKESSAAPSPSKGASNGASKAARVASGAKPKARDLRPAS